VRSLTKHSPKCVESVNNGEFYKKHSLLSNISKITYKEDVMTKENLKKLVSIIMDILDNEEDLEAIGKFLDIVIKWGLRLLVGQIALFIMVMLLIFLS
jgi:hypothetical protein